QHTSSQIKNEFQDHFQDFAHTATLSLRPMRSYYKSTTIFHVPDSLNAGYKGLRFGVQPRIFNSNMTVRRTLVVVAAMLVAGLSFAQFRNRRGFDVPQGPPGSGHLVRIEGGLVV